MLRLLLQLISGFGFLIIGSYCGFLYIKSLEQGNNLLFLMLSFVLLLVGIILLVRSSKSNASIGVKTFDSQTPTDKTQESMINKLQRDNQLLNQWTKTNEARDRLRMLEISAKAEEGN